MSLKPFSGAAMSRWILIAFFITLSGLADTTRVGNNSALVVIDMQSVFVTRGGNAERPENIRKVNEIQERQLELIRIARQNNVPVIFIEYENHGPTNERLREAVNGYSNTRTFIKNTDGMFDTDNAHIAGLSDYLREQEIGNLVITGANGGACVYWSIEGSLRNNYNVIAYSQGIADFNFEEFVYPYDDQYKFETTCESCTFREVDDLPTLSLLMNNPRRETSPNPALNTSERSEARPEVPRARQSRQRRASATAPQ